MSKLRIVVLGSTGMLGYAVGRQFSQDASYDVALSHRNSKLAYGPSFFFDALSTPFSAIPHADYIINCVGCVKQKNHSIDQYVFTNAVFPHKLSAHCAAVGARLIHITTDCVFSGNRGAYTEEDLPDTTDMYGISKILGEAPECMLLRTSIIGEELRENYSLLEWARSQAGKTIQGYVNHMWNGVTAKQYAKICDKLIRDNTYSTGLYHVFSPQIVSKHDMLLAINRKYDLKLNVTAHEHPRKIDRSLASVKTLSADLDIPTVDRMIEEI